MTDFARLFETDAGSQRLVAITGKPALAHGAPGAGESVAAVFPLLDQQTKASSGQSLFVLLSPQNAMLLAKLIQDHAKRRGWPDLGEVARTSTNVPPKSETH